MQSSERFRFRPQVEGFEDRSVPAALTSSAPVIALTAPAATDYNQQIIAFCKSHIGAQVGGGECAHLASEALRVAGADFAGKNYVWGSAITTITKGRDSNPSAACRPGDIIQFQAVTFANGWNTGGGPHTAVVAAVDSRGRPTQVYEQNVGVNGKGPGFHDRHDRLDAQTALNTITSGTITVYRAVPRADKPGQFQFSLNNSTGAPLTVQVQFGTSTPGTAYKLSKNNTPQEALPGQPKPDPCYMTYTASWSNPQAPNLHLVVNGKPLTLAGGASIQNGGGYEIASVGGQLVLRRV
jgi:hypothetical protein